MFYPCLRDYIKEDMTSQIEAISKIFEEIKTESGKIFRDYDATLLQELAYSYYYERGKRPLKVLYAVRCKYVDWEDQTIVEGFFTNLGKVVYARYGRNLETIYNAYFLTDYKPLDNYSMTQERTPNLNYDTTTKRDTNTHVETSSKTKIVPFNERASTLTGESEGDSVTSESKDKNQIETGTKETGKETLTRSGNIGVTTSMQMLTQEVDGRKLDFWKLVFDNVDKVLLRNYYPQDCFIDL